MILNEKEPEFTILFYYFIEETDSFNHGFFVTLKAHIAQQEKEKIYDRVMQGLDVAKKKGKKLGRPVTGVPKEFIKEYNKFQSGEYGSISVVQFAKLQGIAVSTFYKYVGILKENKG